MSWIVGNINKSNTSQISLRNKFQKEKIHFTFKSKSYEILAGGNQQNLHYTNNNNKGWIVAGIGLNNQQDTTTILTSNDWNKHLSCEKSNHINKINGHFVIIKWNSESININTDNLGLRDIYIYENTHNIYFSTNVRLISQLTDLNINYSEFSSRWLLFNQISHNSIFIELRRVVAGGSARINLNNKSEIKYLKSDWKPDYYKTKTTNEKYKNTLNSFININVPENYNLSLSLSGGMDSRVLLSLLLSNKIQFDSHTFGDQNNPDNLIAKKITSDNNIIHENINKKLLPTDILINEIKDYSLESVVNNSASAILQLQNYYELTNRNRILIDGGFGEIWRREFFYKLYVKGKVALLNNDIKNVIPHLKLNRAEIFNRELEHQMNDGVIVQLGNYLSEHKINSKDEIEDWLDLFAIKTRLANYYSHEQIRVDNYLISVMPFVQQSLLTNIFNISKRERKNGRLFKAIVKGNYSKLENYKLAKGDLYIPYNFNSFQTRIYAIVKKQLHKNVTISENIYFLNQVKEYVLDLSISQSVKEADCYDYSKVINIIEKFYNGNLEYSDQLDWWLSFELFRQGIKNKY